MASIEADALEGVLQGLSTLWARWTRRAQRPSKEDVEQPSKSGCVKRNDVVRHEADIASNS